MKIAKLRDALISLMLFGMFSNAAQAEATKLTEVAIVATATKARITIHFDKLPGYKVFTLTNPARVVIDLKDTQLTANLKKLHLAATPILAVRSGPQPQHGLRLVVDLKNRQAPPTLSTSAENIENRLIVEIGGHLAPAAIPLVAKLPEKSNTTQPANSVIDANKSKPEQIKRLNAELAAEAPIGASQKPRAKIGKTALATPAETKIEVIPAKVIVQPAPKKRLIEKAAQSKTKVAHKGQRDVVILLDPGHGGKDPGARGANGSYEKHIVLAISHKLKQLIDQEPGMRAVLTRRGDYFITLRDRLRIARKDKADLFVAIHADAFNNPQSSGASVFALSATGASSEAARWLAEKENYSELGGISLTDKSDVLRSVLIDLSQTGIISLSLQLGTDILKNLGRVTKLHHSRVEQARFVVLKSLDIPSVLVETGFISNENEEQRLNDSAYQQQIAEAVFRGIRNYFRQYPPPGTRLAADKDEGKSAVAENQLIAKEQQFG